MRLFFFGPRLGWFRPGFSFGEQEPRSKYYRPPREPAKQHWTSLIVTIPLALLILTAAATCFALAGIFGSILIKFIFGA